MRLKLLLDPETAAALVQLAVRDLRPADMEAEALIRRGLGLPVPCDPPPVEHVPQVQEEAPHAGA
jgi:hypothetical protein